MASMDMQLSKIVLVIALVLVVTGLVIALFWYFKRAENLTEEDRLNIERAKVAWIGATALAILVLVSAKMEKGSHMMSGRSSAGMV